MSGFFALELGIRGLRAQLIASQVIGHNIANSRTPGYSRQVADLRPPPDLRFTALGRTLTMGTGVTVTGIRRQREEFLDRLSRWHGTDLRRLETVQHSLDLVEMSFAEPAGFGPRQAVLRLWDGFHELAANPESGPVRSAVREEARALAANLSGLATRLEGQRTEHARTAADVVAEINQMAEQIAGLNRQIRMATLQQTEANDLEDRRDLLLDSLAGLVGAVSRRELDDSVTVSVAGSDIVQGDVALPLSSDVAGGVLRVLDSLGSPLSPTGGEMAGLIDLHNVRIPEYINLLDGFARQMADALNAVHRTGHGLDGSTGLDLYRYDPAAPARTLTLAPEVTASPLALAASAGGEPGDGEGALALARVLTDPTFGGQGAAEFWASAIGALGLEVESVTREVDNTRILARQAENRRAEVMGVNLDEETVHLLRSQHAYAAAARLISTADEMLDTLINRTGRVGR